MWTFRVWLSRAATSIWRSADASTSVRAPVDLNELPPRPGIGFRNEERASAVADRQVRQRRLLLIALWKLDEAHSRVQQDIGGRELCAKRLGLSPSCVPLAPETSSDTSGARERLGSRVWVDGMVGHGRHVEACGVKTPESTAGRKSGKHARSACFSA